MTERDALAWFGSPGTIYAGEGGEEYWNYEVVVGTDDDGDEVTQDFSLKFQRGRLVYASGDDDPEDDE